MYINPILYNYYLDPEREPVICHCRIDSMNLEEWVYYTPPKQKKVKFMSPAIYRSLLDSHLFMTQKLFETEEDAKKCGDERSFHSWPAKDANGNPIQYQVEVEE